MEFSPVFSRKPTYPTISSLTSNKEELNYNLCKSAMMGNAEQFTLYLSQGADINYQDPRAKYSVLHCATGNGYHNIVSIMLQYYHLHIDPINSTGRSPLHFASRVGNEKCLRLLIEAGSNVNIQDQEGQTCLHLCARLNHIPAITYLLSIGANKYIRDNKGRSPFDLAKLEFNNQIIKLLS
jgi:ankyrin repeat protein